MRCYDCGETYIEKHGDLHLQNKFIGCYTVKSVKYNQCSNCGQLLFPYETVEIIEAEENRIKNERLSNLPVMDFVSATEASELLGISKQAFSKNTRIKNGFIYSVLISGKKFYHRESILLFKENDDGRFPLYSDSEKLPDYQSENPYRIGNINNIASDDYYLVESIKNVQAYY